MDKVENLEYLYQGYGILEKEWVIDSQCHSVLGSTEWTSDKLPKFDLNLSIISQDIEPKSFSPINQGL